MTIQNVLVVLISYLIGSLLPAELVSWVLKRRPCSEIGSGNPGFANITSSFGIVAGLIVLAGDIAKTYLGMRVAYDFTRGDTLLFTSLLSLCALVTGHNFPLWNLFRGGKGVTVTCTGIILITPTLGIPAVLIGFVLVLLTGWLPLGAVAIPASYLLMCCFLLPEAVPFAIFLTAMMLLRHLPGLIGIFTGKCPRVNPFNIFKRTNRFVEEPEPEPEYYPEEETTWEPSKPAASSDEDDFIKTWLTENEDASAAPGPDASAAAAASLEAANAGLTPAYETGDADPQSLPTTDDNVGPAIWSLPAEGAAEAPAEAPAPEETPETPADKASAPKEEGSSSEALWKTGVLPSLEEIRRHRLRTKQEVPEAKAATSPFQARRHAHRSTSSPAPTTEDVIFYEKTEDKAETGSDGSPQSGQ